MFRYFAVGRDGRRRGLAVGRRSDRGRVLALALLAVDRFGGRRGGVRGHRRNGLAVPDGVRDDQLVGIGADELAGSLGGGLRLPFNDNLAATLGVRGYLTLIESDTSIFCKSDSEGGGCLVRSSGSTFFQAEALLGLTVRF